MLIKLPKTILYRDRVYYLEVTYKNTGHEHDFAWRVRYVYSEDLDKLYHLQNDISFFNWHGESLSAIEKAVFDWLDTHNATNLD